PCSAHDSTLTKPGNRSVIKNRLSGLFSNWIRCLRLRKRRHIVMQSNQPNDGNGTSRTTCSPIVDLRQYTLYPGTRDGFVELFDREFVETQEASGMRVIGQFRDLGD